MYSLDKIKSFFWSQLCVIYLRYLVGGTFVFASLIKLKGKRFTTVSGELEPINSSWHFFETMYQSGLYWKFVGFGQLLAGLLLMTQRYAKLGAVVNFPIALNIFVITLSYYFAFTPVVTGLILFANVLLIVWDWNDLRVLFNLPIKPKLEKGLIEDYYWGFLGLILFLFTFVYRLLIDKYRVEFWGSICTIIGVLGLIYGIHRFRLKKKLI